MSRLLMSSREQVWLALSYLPEVPRDLHGVGTRPAIKNQTAMSGEVA
jgi:hypothetical protein